MVERPSWSYTEKLGEIESESIISIELYSKITSYVSWYFK
jgi:hypothetical protein